MASTPTPSHRTPPRAVPVTRTPPRVVTPGAASQGTMPNAQGIGPVSVDSAIGNVQPVVRARRERILAAGDTTSGKTYMGLRMAEKELNRAIAAGDATQAKKFFWLDTHDAMGAHVGVGEEFEHLAFTNGGNVYPYPAERWEPMRQAWRTITLRAKEGDWIMGDVINHVYDQAKAYYQLKQGRDVVDAQVNGKGFGGMTGSEWNDVGAMVRGFLEPAIYRSPANIMLFAHIAKMVDVPGRERMDQMVLFDQIGYKPRGWPQLPELIHTIIIMNAIRVVDYNDRNQRVSAKTLRRMYLLKDKGKAAYISAVYDRDMYDELLLLRRKMVQDAKAGVNNNITEPAEVAKALEQIEAEKAARIAAAEADREMFAGKATMPMDEELDEE